MKSAEELDRKGLAPAFIDAAHESKQFELVVQWDKELVASIRKAEIAESGKPGTLTSDALGTLASNLLFLSQFREALAAVEEALALRANDKWLSITRAHALLFLGHLEEARSLYGSLWEQRASEYTQPFGEAILNDFRDFEIFGLQNPAFAEIRVSHNVSR